MAQSPLTHAEMARDEERLISTLTSQCSLTAQFDTIKRPRCAESTRETILNKLRDWVESTPDPNSFAASCFWLHGGAGSGKSTIAQSLAEQFNDAGNLAASFFFFSIDASRNKGYRLFPTIIYNLTRINTAYEKKVIDQLKRNQDIFSRPLDQQVKVLFTDPLFTLHAEGVDPSTLPRLIVIDALDECVHDKQTQCDILAIIAQTILSGLPYPFRFLITSRPEGYISRTFEFNKYIRRIPVQKYDLSKDPDASQDIRTLLQQEFTRICQTHPLGSGLENNSWPSENELVALIDRSSGHFVYPASVIQYIASPEHSPDERLKITLGLKPREPEDQPFSKIDAMYMMILVGVEGSGLINIKCAFSILYLISEKIGYFSVYHSGSYRIIEDILLLLPGDLDLLFDPLKSLVAQDSGNLYVLHKTLFDYLLDPERSQQFALTKQLCHENAALYMHNAEMLTNWFYAPDIMCFAYHCYLAQPIQDERLLRFLENLDILYTDRNSTPNTNTNANANTCRYQNQRPLLAMFIDEGEQDSGAKSIFYILRLLSLLSEFKGGQDLHEIHCTKIARFYSGITAKGSGADVNQLNKHGSPATTSMLVDGKGGSVDLHAALDEMIRSKLRSWQPTEDILQVITAANDGSTSTAARDTLISREHAVFASFGRAQHLSNSFYRQQSTILPSDSVAHNYHIFSASHGSNPSLMVLLHTYSRGGAGGVGAVVEDPIGIVGKGAGPGVVCSARGFNVIQLGEKGFKESVKKFLGDHIEKVEMELGQAINDHFESKFKF